MSTLTQNTANKPKGIPTVGLEEEVVRQTSNYKVNASKEIIGGINDTEELEESYRGIGYSDREAEIAARNTQEYDYN